MTPLIAATPLAEAASGQMPRGRPRGCARPRTRASWRSTGKAPRWVGNQRCVLVDGLPGLKQVLDNDQQGDVRCRPWERTGRCRKPPVRWPPRRRKRIFCQEAAVDRPSPAGPAQPYPAYRAAEDGKHVRFGKHCHPSADTVTSFIPDGIVARTFDPARWKSTRGCSA